MSDMYAIKTTTLTALGDAVRSKIIGTTELPITSVVNKMIVYNKAYPYEMPSCVKKVKITGTIDFLCFWPNNETVNIGPNGCQGLGMASGVFSSTSHTNVRKDENYTVVWDGYPANTNELPIVVDFETMVEGNSWTFVATQYSSSPQYFQISFTAIGLDENGNEFKYTPLEMVDVMNGLKVIPSSATTITGDCQYKFSANGWNWFIGAMGDDVKTNDVSSCYYMFYNANNLTHIPFDINITNGISTVSHCFDGCRKLEEVPYIIGPADRALPTNSYSGCITLSHLFLSCESLRYIPDDYFWKIIPNEAYWVKWRELSGQACNSLFQNCYSLRKLPDISMLGAKAESYYNNLYNQMCYQCFNLEEVIDLPVLDASFTSNAFSSVVSYCARLKDFTFATNEDGTPKTAKWKNQTIDLSAGQVGYGYGQYNLNLAHNSGITEDKRISDDATYQALKNNPDCFTHDVNYSRYNHDSAVNTINSLPDCSATGINTIKFKGKAGTLTDAGAINTLTEAEIAVAAAKGWTVSLV